MGKDERWITAPNGSLEPKPPFSAPAQWNSISMLSGIRSNLTSTRGAQLARRVAKCRAVANPAVAER